MSNINLRKNNTTNSVISQVKKIKSQQTNQNNFESFENSNSIQNSVAEKFEKHIFDTLRIKNVKTPVLQTIGKQEIKLRKGAKLVIGDNKIPVDDLVNMYQF